MSDINLNFQGVLALLAAVALGLLLLLGIVSALVYSLIRARRRHEPISRQLLFPQAIGMLVGFGGCAIVVIAFLLAQSSPPPRAIHIWLDHWLWLWILGVLASWQASALAWKSWFGRRHSQLP